MASVHTHFSVLHGFQAFLAIVIIGTPWKLIAMYFVASNSPWLQNLGKAMLFQYGA